MTVKVVEGNLLDATEKYLCHQCNCVSTRAAHLAQAVFRKFPYADVYVGRDYHDIPGSIEVRGDGEKERFVVALFGQVYPGCKYPNNPNDGKAQRERFFWLCLRELATLDGPFAMPWRIGCGAAGGDWTVYLSMIEKASEDFGMDITLYRLPGSP